MEQIKQIAGDENNILLDAISGGFRALDRLLAKKISDVICKNPCDHSTHDHDTAGGNNITDSHRKKLNV